MLISKEDNQKGQLMVEAMVAISLLLVGMMGTFGVLSQSLGLSRLTVDQYIATNLASEGIEVVKNVIDAEYVSQKTFSNLLVSANDKFCSVNYDEGLANCRSTEPKLNKQNSRNFLIKQDNDGMYGSEGEDTNFMRYVFIKFEDIDHDEYTDVIKVESRVFWVGRGGIDLDVVLADRFYNWRSAPL
ncbi:hypothetical protein KKH05_03105 [Patescibacteria group bacterium]|nr:hypothetical protein [Patescibacteria group bacterium]